MNIEVFKKEVAKLGIHLTEKNLKDLTIYKNMLVDYNQKFNLTAITKEEDIYLKHFYDSLTLIKAIDLNKDLKILDIGTGAGFPGLVLKIIFPNLTITLLDSNNKKITFLKEVIKELKLQDIDCISSRAEELPEEYRDSFDLVISRAVSHLRILAEISLPFVKVGGYFLPMKGLAKEEIEESTKTLEILNAKILNCFEFLLPIENSNRTIIKIEKQKETPRIYPRKYDQIKKNPLK